MIAKVYQKSLETSMKVQQDAQLTLKKQKSLLRLEKEQKKIKALFDKQDKLKQESIKREEEKQYIKYRTEFNSRMNSVDKEQKELEKKKLRESSISSQEYMRNFKKLNQESEQLFYHEVNEKSYNDLLWKQQQEKMDQQRKASDLKLKKQEFAIFKIVKNEELIQKIQYENELTIKYQLQQSQNNVKQTNKLAKQKIIPKTQLIDFRSVKKQ